MSRVYVIEIPEASVVTGREFLHHILDAFPNAELRCTMSFESWVKLNGYDKSVPVPAFLPAHTDPSKVHDHLKNTLTTSMDERGKQ